MLQNFGLTRIAGGEDFENGQVCVTKTREAFLIETKKGEINDGCIFKRYAHFKIITVVDYVLDVSRIEFIITRGISSRFGEYVPKEPFTDFSKFADFFILNRHLFPLY